MAGHLFSKRPILVVTDLTKTNKLLKQILSAKRYAHSLRVAEFSKEIANVNNCSQEKAFLAGLLHDNAREFSDAKLLKVAKEKGLTATSKELETPVLLHGKVGAWQAKILFGIDDFEILKAIENHTLGAKKMSVLEKIVYVADFAEPARKLPLAVKVRRLALLDLDKAVESKSNGVLQYFH